jgi:hypothetical protein
VLRSGDFSQLRYKLAHLMVPRPSARRRQSSISSVRSSAVNGAAGDSDNDNYEDEGGLEIDVEDLGGSDFESSDLPSPVPVRFCFCFCFKVVTEIICCSVPKCASIMLCCKVNCAIE